MQGTVAAKDAEIAEAMGMCASLEAKVEQAMAGAEKALEQASVWQVRFNSILIRF